MKELTKKQGIVLKSHEGTFRVLKSIPVGKDTYHVLESETYGKQAYNIILKNRSIVADKVDGIEKAERMIAKKQASVGKIDTAIVHKATFGDAIEGNRMLIGKLRAINGIYKSRGIDNEFTESEELLAIHKAFDEQIQRYADMLMKSKVRKAEPFQVDVPGVGRVDVPLYNDMGDEKIYNAEGPFGEDEYYTVRIQETHSDEDGTWYNVGISYGDVDLFGEEFTVEGSDSDVGDAIKVAERKAEGLYEEYMARIGGEVEKSANGQTAGELYDEQGIKAPVKDAENPSTSDDVVEVDTKYPDAPEDPVEGKEKTPFDIESLLPESEDSDDIDDLIQKIRTRKQGQTPPARTQPFANNYRTVQMGQGKLNVRQMMSQPKGKMTKR